MAQDKKPPRKKVDRAAVRLFIEIGVIGIIFGLMISIISEACYEGIVGADPSLELAFFVFWVSFSTLFFIVGIFAYRIARSLGVAGYRVSPGGIFGWCKRRVRNSFSVRGAIVLTIIASIALVFAAIAALVLVALVFVARNPDMFFE